MKPHTKIILWVLLIVFSLVGVTIWLSTTDETRENPESFEKSFPDFTSTDISADAEYPAPVKQLQQVLTHSYVNEPSDEELEIDMDLSELNFNQEGYSQPEELQKLQAQLNELKSQNN